MQIVWEEEFEGLSLGDQRTEQRFIQVLKDLQEHPGASLLEASEDPHQAKGAYRLLDNPKVIPERILDLHRERSCVRAAEVPVALILQDTTVLNYQSHLNAEGLGRIGRQANQAKPSGGLHMHTALAVTPGKVPLGILDQVIWPRQEPSSKNRPITDKESMRWLLSLEKSLKLPESAKNTQFVTVSDRESDINAYLGEAVQQKADILIRGRSRRIDLKTGESLAESLLSSPVLFEFAHEVRRNSVATAYKRKKIRLKTAESRQTDLEVRARTCSLTIEDREGNKSSHPFQCIHVSEKLPTPEGWEPIEWMLVTTLPVKDAQDAKKIISYYEARWTIEVFHKVLKTDLQVEECRLETADRLSRYLTMESLIAMQLCRMMYFQREEPEADVEEILPERLWRPLCVYMERKHKIQTKYAPTAKEATIWMAKLGGYPGRRSDPPPGATVLKRGWRRLNDLADGFELATKRAATCG